MNKITKNTKFSIIDEGMLDDGQRSIHAYHLTADEVLKKYNKLTGYCLECFSRRKN